MNDIFSLAYLTIPNTPPVEQIEIAAQCGYEGVGLRTISQKLTGEPDYGLADNQTFRQVRSALERTGIKLMDIELARVADGVDVANYEKEFALGAELGAQYAIASVWTNRQDFARQQFEAMSDLADKYNLKLNLEFVPFSQVRTLQDALDWIQLINRPNVQVLVDTLHAHRAETTAAQLQAVPQDKVGFVHLCDGPAFIPPIDHPDMISVARTSRQYLGQGDIDIAGMMRVLPQPPYYAIELPNAQKVMAVGKLEHARRCLKSTKEYFAQRQITHFC